MIGIYKITNPQGKIYIGQSINIEKRWKYYKSLDCIKQPKLYRSLKKYGPNNHTFDIIEKLEIEILLTREIYWKIFHNSVKDGLNCSLYDRGGGPMSQETKDKIGKANSKPKPEGFGENHSKKLIGKKKSKEFGENVRKRQIGVKFSEERKFKMRKPKSISYPCSEEKAKKISESNKNRKLSKEHKNNISKARKGIKQPEGFSLKQSLIKKGKKYRLDKTIYKFLNKETGEIFKGTQFEFYNKFNIPRGSVNSLIRKEQKSVKKWILITP